MKPDIFSSLKRTGFHIIRLIFIISVLLCIRILPPISPSRAYFNSNAAIGGLFQAGIWSDDRIKSGDIVINEVFFNVDPDHGKDGDNANPDEWVELYNRTDHRINLKNWYLRDDTSDTTLSHPNVYIEPHGFALVAKGSNTWKHWSLPDGVVKIETGPKIGDGLGNTGDKLELYDPNGQLIDRVSWGTDLTMNPSVPFTASGFSIERHPCGTDTDTYIDFTPEHPPTPGSCNDPSVLGSSSLILTPLSDNPDVSFFLSPDKRSLQFTANNVGSYYALIYDITYNTDAEPQELKGEIFINGKDTISRDGLLLATCSDGDTETVCNYHEIKGDITLTLMLDSPYGQKQIIKKIKY